jgi:hypothetical protein
MIILWMIISVLRHAPVSQTVNLGREAQPFIQGLHRSFSCLMKRPASKPERSDKRRYRKLASSGAPGDRSPALRHAAATVQGNGATCSRTGFLRYKADHGQSSICRQGMPITGEKPLALNPHPTSKHPGRSGKLTKDGGGVHWEARLRMLADLSVLIDSSADLSPSVHTPRVPPKF